MIYLPHFFRWVAVGVMTIGLAPLACPGPSLAAQQGQTKEPPLPGAQPAPIPPPPPPPQQYIQQQPVPITPGQIPPPPPLPQRQIQQPLPGSIVPGPIIPGPVPQQPLPGMVPVMPAPVPQPPPAIVEVPCPPVDPPSPLVKLRMRVLACSPEGQRIEYSITIENCSPAPAHHVLVRNPLPPNCKFVFAKPQPAEVGPEIIWTFGTLCPGECREIMLVLCPTDSCDVKNCARVQFEHGQCVITRIARAFPGAIVVPGPVGPEKEPATEKGQGVEKDPSKEPPKVTTSGTAKLDLKITGPKKQYTNLPAKYQIAVTNTGDGVTENLVLSALLPDRSAFLNASDNGVFHYDEAAWRLGNLAPGSSKTVEVTYRMTIAGDACLKATGLADGNVRAEAEACTDFEGVSALHLETMDTKDPVEVGGDTSYRVTVFNQGTVDLTNIQFQVLVPSELMLLRATGPTSPPPPQKLPAATAQGQTLTFEILKQLKPGEKQTYEIFAKAVKPGDARWRAVLTADELTGGPVTEEESTTIFGVGGESAGQGVRQSARKDSDVLFPSDFRRYPSPPRSIQSPSQSVSVGVSS
jgi:uncharacterized repeat protein (TIGR01451 family)